MRRPQDWALIIALCVAAITIAVFVALLPAPLEGQLTTDNTINVIGE